MAIRGEGFKPLVAVIAGASDAVLCILSFLNF